MCQDHFSRRSFLHGATVLAAGSVLLPRKAPPRLPARLPLRSADRAVSADGNLGYSMAMHIHSSFDEFFGSMDAQLYQATVNTVDVCWWTSHDFRMRALDDRDVVHFTSLTDEAGGKGQGGVWDWQSYTSGALASAPASGIVQTPCSPNDPVSGGAMYLTVKAKKGNSATRGYHADSMHAGWNYQVTLDGQSLAIDILPTAGWTASNGYLELLIGTSYHEASASGPSGQYSVAYQIAPGTGAVTSAAQGNAGIVTVPLNGPGGPTVTLTPASGDSGWMTMTINPAQDIASLWPALDYRDFGLSKLSLSATSLAGLVGGYFDYLRFTRENTGSVALQQQEAMTEYLALAYPAVTQQQGMEVSWRLPHLNWFGNVSMTSYPTSITAAQWAVYLASTVIPEIHAAGGLASYNHPFGATWDYKPLPQSQQDSQLATVAASLLPSGDTPAALGADIIEVGYPIRAQYDLAHHVGLWDVLSRNGCFLTGNGASDDHWGIDWTATPIGGRPWSGPPMNWVTSVWAPSTAQSDLLAALAAGQAWCGSLTGFGPSTGACLNLEVDGECPMGSASLSSLTSRQLAVTAMGVPSGGSVQVLQGAVDYAGTNGLASNAQVIQAYSDTAMAAGAGQVTLPVDTTSESYVRLAVLAADGQTVVALSNPVWLLQNAPPNGIPAARQA